jgi:hypothetical protein
LTCKTKIDEWIKYSVVDQAYIRLNSLSIALMFIYSIALFSCDNSTRFDKKVRTLLENNNVSISKAVDVNKSSNNSAVTYTFILNKDEVISLVNKLGLKPYDNEVIVYDGGFWYWRIEYDVEKDRCLNFSSNG